MRYLIPRSRAFLRNQPALTQSAAASRLRQGDCGTHLPQAPYGIRSERQLVAQFNDNVLFRCSIGLSIDNVVRRHVTFSKNRDRLPEHEAILTLFAKVVRMSGAADLYGSARVHYLQLGVIVH